MNRMSYLLLLLVFTLTPFRQALGRAEFQSVSNLLSSLRFIKHEGLLASVVAKELCSCLFVHELLDRSAATQRSEQQQLRLAVNQCTDRAQIPLFSIIKRVSAVRFEIIELKNPENLEMTSTKYPYVIRAKSKPLITAKREFDESTREVRYTPSIDLSRSVTFVAEAFPDKNQVFGCRMRLLQGGVEAQSGDDEWLIPEASGRVVYRD